MPDASVNEVPKDLLTWKTRVNCERGNTPTAPKKGSEKMEIEKTKNSQDQQGSSEAQQKLRKQRLAIEADEEYGLECNCSEPVLNEDLVKRTENKLRHYRCGQCSALWVNPSVVKP
tara:strand:+ start:5811 stop:6158 length:348 start_codon:yes stop_codon:yes gene_type:complete